jgi:hypothetical protein
MSSISDKNTLDKDLKLAEKLKTLILRTKLPIVGQRRE